VAARYRLGPIFTPAVVSKFEGPLGTLMLPATTGGANWRGGSYDPETGFLYVFSNTQMAPIALVPGKGRSDEAWVEGAARAPATSPPAGSSSTRPSTRAGAAAGGAAAGAGAAGEGGKGGAGLSIMGLPLVKPPWGRITAIDFEQGEIVWQVAHGETPDVVRNHPALKGINIPRTGRPGRIGTLVTKTLVIAGEGGFFTTPGGRRGAMLRAYDKATGKEVGAVYMPAPQTGSPMTYMLNGRHYIVVAVSGGVHTGELLAFKLPA
jgi:quinoprotein glucose dehydrogenase